MGGRVPGSESGDSTSIFQEGLRVPPVQLYAAGKVRADVLELFLLNSRTPHYSQGDLLARAGHLHPLIGEHTLHVRHPHQRAGLAAGQARSGLRHGDGGVENAVPAGGHTPDTTGVVFSTTSVVASGDGP